jgi:hypothetical protein
MKKILGILSLVILFGLTDALAQTSLGVSYERRNEAPTNGFGLQLEKNILGSVPVIDIRARLHGSFFSEDADLTIAGLQATTGTVQSYDFGAALIGGAGLGLFRPYVGLGVGMENWEFDGAQNYTNNTHYYYGLAGIAVTPLPFIKPYMEFRFSSYDSLSDAREEIGEGNARFHIGVTLSF